jgi:hypothetical protein
MRRRWGKTNEQDIFFSPGLVVRIYFPPFYKIGNNKKIEMPLAENCLFIRM